jgi:hypothetical protein
MELLFVAFIALAVLFGIGKAMGGGSSASRGSRKPVEKFDPDEVLLFNESSPSQEFSVSYGGGYEDERGRWVKGAVALKNLSGDSTVYITRLARPNMAYVSDTGHVWVEDWRSGEMSGAVVALDPAGEKLWSKVYRANIRSTQMSPDRVWLIADTCQCQHEAHSDRRFIIFAETGEVAAKVELTDSVEFSNGSTLVHLRTPKGDAETVTLDRGVDSLPDLKKPARRVARIRKAGDPRTAFGAISDHMMLWIGLRN